MEEEQFPLTCVICGKEIKQKKGSNLGCDAWPIKKGRCCYDCNETIVMEERYKLHFKKMGLE